jgi:hypothetical protein
MTSTDDQDIPEPMREQLGVGVRGKYTKHFAESNNVGADQQSIGRIVGQRKEREIGPHASGESLHEGALFGESLQALGASFRFPRGVFRYKTHEDADRHWLECVVDGVVATQERRRGQ